MTDTLEEPQYIQSLSAKDIKKLMRPQFAANPDNYYPTPTLRNLGFQRYQCMKCKNNFWSTRDRETCGDSNCEGKYSFIGQPRGIAKERGQDLTYGEAFETFKEALGVKCTPIPRYPVVARWRADVDYVAAGIFCFQPYVVTGELEPPANPLICGQPCLRFNDLDNVGLTGRHYSGFVMLGIQAFNKGDDERLWMAECVELNYKWLTDKLKIDPSEITFIEDVWAGGGNLGPSMEYFVGGLELGNMVFMQYKTFPDGRCEELAVRVIDVGIGLERVPWLVNGTATSYDSVFPTAGAYLKENLNSASTPDGTPIIDMANDVWRAFGPYSCLLNVDETENLQQTWADIGQSIGKSGAEIKAAIEPIRDFYTVLDHTRSVLFAVYDGSLPSNVGGAANVRNILRRAFAICKKRNWWDILTFDGFMEIFEMHKQDLAPICGEFAPYVSFREIIKLEFDRWQTTDKDQKEKLDKLIKKRKGKLTMDDWIIAITAYGIPAEVVQNITGLEVPGNLYYEIADRQERSVKALPAVLYSTSHLPETKSLYYQSGKIYDFSGKILEVMYNALSPNQANIVILDESAFYPTSGGQEHDTGILTINGILHIVVDVLKVGPCVLHVLDKPLPDTSTPADLAKYIGTPITGSVDIERRDQLRTHHTATHIIYAACRLTLGPHVWQNGAKKQPHLAHLDITHYSSLTHDQVLAIQTTANRIVQSSKPITKSFMPKDVAEKQYGFHLYQGGIVPGNSLRVVNITDTDTEACCGTHADSTSEVGLIKITKAARISDGILRIYFVAGELALKLINEDSRLINTLASEWGISQQELVATGQRFFDGYKRYGATVSKQAQQLVELQLQLLLLNPEQKLVVLRTTESNPTLYISIVPNFAARLQAAGKGLAVVGDTFIYGLLGNPSLFNINTFASELQATYVIEEKEEKESKENSTTKKPSVAFKTRDAISCKTKDNKGKKVVVKVTGLQEFTMFGLPIRADTVVELFKKHEFVESISED